MNNQQTNKLDAKQSLNKAKPINKQKPKSTSPKHQLSSKALTVIASINALFEKASYESLTLKELNNEWTNILQEIVSTFPGGRGIYTLYEQGYITSLFDYRLKSLQDNEVVHAYVIDNVYYTSEKYDWSEELSDYITEMAELGETITDFELSLYQQGYYYKRTGKRFV